MNENFRISKAAIARITEIIDAQEDAQTLALRVAVLSGGCNGFQYQFKLEHNQEEDDILIEQDGARILVDSVSLDLLAGAELDFIDKLMGAHFTIHNPQAATSCGCGNSFSLA